MGNEIQLFSNSKAKERYIKLVNNEKKELTLMKHSTRAVKKRTK